MTPYRFFQLKALTPASAVRRLQFYIKTAILIIIVAFLSIDAFSQDIPRTRMVHQYARWDHRISEAEREAIISSIQSLVDRYYYSSDFADMNGEFEDDKFLMFTRLFYGTSTITNFVSKKPEHISASSYSNFIYDHIRPRSLDLRSNRSSPPQLNKVEIDASQNYQIFMFIHQDLYSVYDPKAGGLVPLPSPVRVLYEAEIRIEKSDISDAKFMALRGDTGKRSFGSEGYLSIAPYYGTGFLAKSSGSGFENISPGVSSYGIWADMIKGLDDRGKLFLWLGLNAGFFNVNSDFTGKYKGSATNFKDQLEVIRYTENGFSSLNVESDVTILSIESGSEKINGANIFSGLVGIGYRFNVGIQNMLTLKLGLSPTFLANVGKGSRTTEFDGIELPADKSNFPGYSDLPNDIRHLYSFIPAGENIPGNEKLITAENNFSLSVILAPSFQIPIGHGWGIDIGAAFSYGINSLFKHTNNEKAFLSRGSDESVSIIQDYLQNSQIRHFQITAGIYYRL